ncbi:hypothetical protein KUTG_00287 [Kutzneria sp. 744]|nr:hypothetical protein KUTG_00287 [Kutzneria sp. 744]
MRLGLTPTAAALLADALRGSRKPLLRIALLSAVEAAPVLAAGWVTAAALDQGFLTGRPGVGLAWLGPARRAVSGAGLRRASHVSTPWGRGRTAARPPHASGRPQHPAPGDDPRAGIRARPAFPGSAARSTPPVT